MPSCHYSKCFKPIYNYIYNNKKTSSSIYQTLGFKQNVKPFRD